MGEGEFDVGRRGVWGEGEKRESSKVGGGVATKRMEGRRRREGGRWGEMFPFQREVAMRAGNLSWSDPTGEAFEGEFDKAGEWSSKAGGRRLLPTVVGTRIFVFVRQPGSRPVSQLLALRMDADAAGLWKRDFGTKKKKKNGLWSLGKNGWKRNGEGGE
jgi:hypothetical protein